MNMENKLSIINTHLSKAVMESEGTSERDWLMEAHNNVRKALWHIQKSKEIRNQK